MRLRTACTAPPRTWTIELRPHPSGLALVCRQCPRNSRDIAADSARSAALAHLARHARDDLRPPHLRTCQCHEHGCRWHPRHRGCTGPIRLLLAREHGGRIWRLADTCSACAAATTQAAVVPDTALTPAPRPERRRRRNRRLKGPDERTRVRDMLSYLAVTLPAGTAPATRLLALQCALRVDNDLRVRLPQGVLRSLRLDGPETWHELERSRWLRTTPTSTSGEIAVQLFDATLLSQAPARPDRRRAADWALRASRPSRTGTTGVMPRLASVYLAAHADPSGRGLTESDRMARVCGLPSEELVCLLNQLTAAGYLGAWQSCPYTEDLHWVLGPPTEGSG